MTINEKLNTYPCRNNNKHKTTTHQYNDGTTYTICKKCKQSWKETT